MRPRVFTFALTGGSTAPCSGCRDTVPAAASPPTRRLDPPARAAGISGKCDTDEKNDPLRERPACATTSMTPLVITHYTATTCVGHGVASLLAAVKNGHSGLAPCGFQSADLNTWVGEVPGLDSIRVPPTLSEFDCRNNRLAHLAMRQDGFEDAARSAIAKHGSGQVGLFIGTSTSGILETEIAYRHRDPLTGELPTTFRYRGAHNTFSVAAFLRAALGLEGPTVVVSTACSSSAKVFASARRMIDAGLIRAAIVGGVDSLCLTTLYGFHSLQLTSAGPCRPFAVDRDGISIGEGAALALLEHAGPASTTNSIALLGVGESSDAHHLSAPHPEGLGAQLAMRAAMQFAEIEASAIDYVNLHGTATPSNDRAEARALNAVFADGVACSSTKGATGHTLGAAGAVEAVICALSLRHGFLPGGINTPIADPSLGLRYLTSTVMTRAKRILSNSFGFGGSNCSLLLGTLG